MKQRLRRWLTRAPPPTGHSSPVPQLDTRSERRWTVQSELIGIDIREASQLALLDDVCAPLRDEYEAFEQGATAIPHEFHRDQLWFGPVDAEVLYCLVRHLAPKLVIEVGAGFTTRLTAAALVRNAAGGKYGELVAIDPHPGDVLRRGMPGLTALRVERLQDVEHALFDRLGADDILFIDSSHVVHVDSDARDLVLDIVPRLRPGAFVHFHDIFLPLEYPRAWVVDQHHFFNEQYFVQAFLAFNKAFEVVWAASYMHLRHPDRLRQMFPSYDPATVHPGSLWLRRVAA